MGHNGEGGLYYAIDFKNFYALCNGILGCAVVGATSFKRQCLRDITVRVFTLPVTDGTAQELPGSPLNLGSLEAKSALNLKLAEDVLIPMGIPTPYTTDGGNWTLEFTIQAADVVDTDQVFNNSLTLAFGTYPMEVIQ